MKLTESEVVERALTEYGRTLSRRYANRNPAGIKLLGKSLPESSDE
jgi:hypothetical protein